MYNVIERGRWNKYVQNYYIQYVQYNTIPYIYYIQYVQWCGTITYNRAKNYSAGSSQGSRTNNNEKCNNYKYDLLETNLDIFRQ